MSAIRAVTARVVRPDRAPHTVTAMWDSLHESTAADFGLRVDPAAYAASGPALYVYRQCHDGAAHTGLVCEVAIESFLDGRVRAHEAVHPARVEALVRHYRTTVDRPALVTLIHRTGPAFASTLDEARRTPPFLDFTGPGGRHQSVWRVDDAPTGAAVADELAEGHHYIADGHHRVMAALEEWRRDGKPAGAGLLCVVHPMDGLRLSAFHRRLTGPVDKTVLFGLLAREFDVQEVPEPPTPAPGALGLYVARRWYDVRYRGHRPGGRYGLDVSILQAQVVDPPSRPGLRHPIEIASARTPIDDLTRRCDSDGGALFTLAPPPLEVITMLADAGVVVPPKTTYFEPKPCVGIFVRP